MPYRERLLSAIKTLNIETKRLPSLIGAEQKAINSAYTTIRQVLQTSVQSNFVTITTEEVPANCSLLGEFTLYRLALDFGAKVVTLTPSYQQDKLILTVKSQKFFGNTGSGNDVVIVRAPPVQAGWQIRTQTKPFSFVDFSEQTISEVLTSLLQ